MAYLAAIVLAVAAVYAWRAELRYRRASRWRQAVNRRDYLIRERAERVRLHRSVKDIDAELKPLVARMIGGAV